MPIGSYSVLFLTGRVAFCQIDVIQDVLGTDQYIAQEVHMSRFAFHETAPSIIVRSKTKSALVQVTFLSMEWQPKPSR